MKTEPLTKGFTMPLTELERLQKILDVRYPETLEFEEVFRAAVRAVMAPTVPVETPSPEPLSESKAERIKEALKRRHTFALTKDDVDRVFWQQASEIIAILDEPEPAQPLSESKAERIKTICQRQYPSSGAFIDGAKYVADLWNKDRDEILTIIDEAEPAQPQKVYDCPNCHGVKGMGVAGGCSCDLRFAGQAAQRREESPKPVDDGTIRVGGPESMMDEIMKLAEPVDKPLPCKWCGSIAELWNGEYYCRNPACGTQATNLSDWNIRNAPDQTQAENLLRCRCGHWMTQHNGCDNVRGQCLVSGCPCSMFGGEHQPEKPTQATADSQPLTGIDLIAAERTRQIEKEGWSLTHDHEHECGQLVQAAICYAIPTYDRKLTQDDVPADWPWENKQWKPTPKDRVRELVKAGALLAAEIDRLSITPPAPKPETVTLPRELVQEVIDLLDATGFVDCQIQLREALKA